MYNIIAMSKRQEKIKDIADEIYETHFHQVYRFFYFKTLSKESAEDLTYQTFLSFIENLKKKIKIDNYNAYLYSIARNIFAKFLKEKYHADIIISNENFYDFIQGFLEEIDKTPSLEDRALKYIDKLPSKQRQVIFLRLIQKEKISDIAKKLHKNINYVKVTQKRAIISLKRLIASGVI